MAEQSHRIELCGGSFAAPAAIRHLGKAANAKFTKRNNFGNSNGINASLVAAAHRRAPVRMLSRHDRGRVKHAPRPTPSAI
ncbi:MAG: hypothetical protein ACHP7H_06335, partial [Hyphomicrobiales bacterium]